VKCDPSARPDASSGVRVVKQYWRRGEASSYDEGDIRGSRGRPNPLADALRAFDESNAARAALDLDVCDVDPDVHPVLRALLERKRSGSKPGARADGMRIGLAVEGGGMKGVISAGACGEVLRMGFSDCFDAVYGSSAGAMNLTYYLAQQPEGVAAYQEDLVGGEFLDLRRIPKTRRSRRLMGTPQGRRPAMDVSYLVDGVMDGTTGRALRWDRVMRSAVPLKVVATSLDTLTPVMLEAPFESVADLKTCLKASAAVPTLAGPEPITHRGQRLVDAAVMEPVPVHAAATDGCTHVLVLLTRTLPDPKPRPPRQTRASRAPSPPSNPTSDRTDFRADSTLVAATSAGARRAGDGAGPSLSRRRPFARARRFVKRRFFERRTRGSAASSTSGDVVLVDETLRTETDETVAEEKALEDEGAEGEEEEEEWVAYDPPRKSFMSWAFGPLVYRVVRRALLSPKHMRDAWRTHDATRRLVGDGATHLDEALVMARDDPRGARDAAVFPGGAHVFSISPDPADLPPKGVGSLCVKSETLQTGNVAGVRAVNRVLARLLGEEDVGESER
jgi:predicted patatin/cPLA2 family phospholipase